MIIIGFRRDCDSVGSGGERGTRAQGHGRRGRRCTATNSADGRETDYPGHGGDQQCAGWHAIVVGAGRAPRGGAEVATKFRHQLIS